MLGFLANKCTAVLPACPKMKGEDMLNRFPPAVIPIYIRIFAPEQTVERFE